MRKASGALHFYINGIDQGKSPQVPVRQPSGSRDEDLTTVCCCSAGVAAAQTPSVVYGVVDLYGMAVKVTIVHNHNHSDRLRRNNAIMRALSPDVGRPRPSMALTSDSEGPDRLLFHPNCGQKAAIICDGRTALRPQLVLLLLVYHLRCKDLILTRVLLIFLVQRMTLTTVWS